MSDTLTPTQIPNNIVNPDAGESARTFAAKRQSALTALQKTGMLKPATILNFNPVRLKVEDGHVRTVIPAATDEIKRSIAVDYGGKKYVASYVTFANAETITWPMGTRYRSPEDTEPVSEFDVRFVLPIEMGFVYLKTYNDPQQQNMGGVVVYEGDIHTFTKNPQTLRVPTFERLPDGTRAYFSEEASTGATLAAALEKQKEYCGAMMRRGDEFNQTEQEARNITTPMRTWAQFALDMGWTAVAPEWMQPRLGATEACKGCGKNKTRDDAWFCQCGRPYSPYSAFMAGENVPESYLMTLKGKELDDVLKELGRREDLKAKFRKTVS